MRVCAEPGCPTVSVKQRCAKHALPGYGRAHRRAASPVMANATRCAACGQRPTPSNPLERGHIVARQDGGQHTTDNYQAQCRSCNRRGWGTTTSASEGAETPHVSRGVYGSSEAVC